MDRYRTLGNRIIALIIDALIFVPLIGLVSLVDQYGPSETLAYVVAIFYALLSLGYNILLHWKFGQTVGKMVMKLKVVDVSERPITLKQAFLRDIFYLIVAPLVPIVGWTFAFSGRTSVAESRYAIELVSSILTFLWLIVDTFVCVKHEKDRALHDLIAGTIVVRLDVPETPTDESKLEPPGPEHYDELRAA